jgi:hypothetical protein
MTIARVTLFWYLALIVVQIVCYGVAQARRLRMSDFEAGPVIGAVLLAFDFIRFFWHSVLSLKVIAAGACLYCIVVLARRAARGERWSAGEVNVAAFACFCASGALLDFPAAALTLFVIAAIAGTIATLMLVRLASGSPAPAR